MEKSHPVKPLNFAKRPNLSSKDSKRKSCKPDFSYLRLDLLGRIHLYIHYIYKYRKRKRKVNFRAWKFKFLKRTRRDHVKNKFFCGKTQSRPSYKSETFPRNFFSKKFRKFFRKKISSKFRRKFHLMPKFFLKKKFWPKNKKIILFFGWNPRPLAHTNPD